MPDFEHVIAFHIMMDGWCWAQLADESQPEVRLEQGDAVIFVRGDAHFMSTERGKRAAPDLSLYYRPHDRPLPFIFNEFGGSGEKSRFVCGYLGCDARPFNPILDALPPLLHVKRSSVGGQLTARPDPRGAAGERESARRRRDDPLETERAHVPAGGA